MELIINEIFYSIQGESRSAGLTSLFVRLAGCNLNCSYCDSEYARYKGTSCSIDKIVSIAAAQKPFNHVTITGGEPLIQENTSALISRLIDDNYNVQIETNGSIPLNKINPIARKIVDVKTPSSGESSSFHIDNLKYMTRNDELKFVVSGKEDFDFSVDFIDQNLRDLDILVNFSPAAGSISAAELSSLIIEKKLNVRLNLQLHKIIWSNTPENKILENLLK